ncbi:2Fe-2S iron-sulfur cluster-binding protein [Ferrimonas senticii]|uniref:2Fe-2S iron-sulfur cluster-binding protein n=1 Tax=Ferrimonas senticii TaxID=394566 RepID=UPI0004059E3F|nr:2Fe-2S iron-sulfur cluster-binding protein [Ferrimonas senticii]
MPIIEYQQQCYALKDGDNLLQGLLDAGAPVPHSCRSGVCQSCMVQVLKGSPEPKAQLGLTPQQKQLGMMLACQCHPQQDLSIDLPQRACRFPARKLAAEWLADDVLQLRLSSPIPFIPGQSIQLDVNGRQRRFSIASVPPKQSYIELHIEHRLSSDLCQQLFTLSDGAELLISHAQGQCVYDPTSPRQPLLLIGVHTGLAPLYGLAQHALQQGHQADIRLIHFYRGASCYLQQPLRTLAQQHPNLDVQLLPLDSMASRINDWLPTNSELHHSQAFLAGQAPLLEPLARQLFIAGVARKHLHLEGFGRS